MQAEVGRSGGQRLCGSTPASRYSREGLFNTPCSILDSRHPVAAGDRFSKTVAQVSRRREGDEWRGHGPASANEGIVSVIDAGVVEPKGPVPLPPTYRRPGLFARDMADSRPTVVDEIHGRSGSASGTVRRTDGATYRDGIPLADSGETRRPLGSPPCPSRKGAGTDVVRGTWIQAPATSSMRSRISNPLVGQ